MCCLLLTWDVKASVVNMEEIHRSWYCIVQMLTYGGKVLPSFFISNISVGKRGNTSTVVGHCIL
jgi:hypothetical protein